MKLLFSTWVAVVFFNGCMGQQHVSLPHKVVMELFTSQGCSSCPPAERLAADLSLDSNLILLTYHVDYWNYLGWKDPFSKNQFTKKQYHYAEVMELSSVYTPQAVVNGTLQTVGSNRSKLEALFQASKPLSTLIKDLSVKHSGNRLQVKAHYSGNNIIFEYLTVLQDAETKILAGENAGALLRHINSVISSKEGKDNEEVELEVSTSKKKEVYKLIVLVRDAKDYSIKDAVFKML